MNNTQHPRAGVFLIIIFVLPLTCISLFSSAEEIDELIVTSQKREQRLFDVPMSITALPGELLEQAGIENLDDLSYTVPGFSVSELGPGSQILAIRGAGSERGDSSLTGIYMDEVPVASTQLTAIDLRTVDLERVEVLKGPQGTLYGEGSTGGTIRFITKDPELNQFSDRIDMSLYNTEDSGWSQEMTGIANLPLVENIFGLRIAATYENKDGWIDQPAASREDINDSELTNIRLKALWQMTDRLTAKAMVINHRNKGGGLNNVNLAPREESNFISAIDPTRPSDFKDNYEIYNLTLVYDLDFATLLSSSSITKMDKLFQHSQFADLADSSELQLLTRDESTISDIFTQEVRLDSTGSGPLNWTAGIFHRDLDGFFSNAGIDVAINGTFLSTLPSGPGDYSSKSLSAFGDLSYQLTERLEAGIGVRYFEDDRTVLDISGTTLEGSFDAITPRAYLSYAPTAEMRLYLNISEGFRSGGFNDAATVAAGAPATYKPEELIAYEVGTKMSLLEGSLSIEAALFYSEYTELQTLGIIGPVEGGTAFISNVGQAEIRGGEWAIRWAPLEHLTLSFSGDVIDTEVITLGPATGTASIVGDPIDFIPEHSLSLMCNYDVYWTKAIPGFIRLLYSQQGKATNTARNAGLLFPQDESPVLDFLNASIGADIGIWSVELFGRNLLNEDEELRPSYSGWRSQARPRTIGVNLGIDF